jgi:hypothetical protein
LPPELLELLRQSSLFGSEPLELLPNSSATSHRQHSRALLTETTLLLRQLSQTLQRFSQS